MQIDSSKAPLNEFILFSQAFVKYDRNVSFFFLNQNHIRFSFRMSTKNKELNRNLNKMLTEFNQFENKNMKG